MMIEKAFGSDLCAESFFVIKYVLQEISNPAFLYADYMYTEIPSNAEYAVYL